MNRDWLTLVFGIVLVVGVVGLSIWHNADGLGLRPGRGSEARAAAAESRAENSGSTSRESAPQPDALAESRAARVDVSVPVVHKHRFGSCEGTLRARGDSLSYGTPHEQDAFRLPLREVEQFDIDVAKDNLRVRRRGGRTWNFTGRSGNSAALITFHREVSRVRARPAAR